MKSKKEAVSLKPVDVNDGIMVFLDHRARTWTFPMYIVTGFMTDILSGNMGELRIFQRDHAPTVSLMVDIQDATFQIDRWKDWVQANVGQKKRDAG